MHRGTSRVARGRLGTLEHDATAAEAVATCTFSSRRARFERVGVVVKRGVGGSIVLL
jgi:hypothetical protein